MKHDRLCSEEEWDERQVAMLQGGVETHDDRENDGEIDWLQSEDVEAVPGK